MTSYAANAGVGHIEARRLFPCTVPGCETPQWSRGWCRTHYNRWHRNGHLELVQKRRGQSEIFWRGHSWLVGVALYRDRGDGCWDDWPMRRTRDGYAMVGERPATHIMLDIVGAVRPIDATQALHSCDNPPCLNPTHLRWGTPAENAQDRVDRDRTRKGIPRPKVTEEEAAEFRRLYATGLRQHEVADRVGRSVKTVAKFL